ncbi:hypothetical protein KYG_03094 [Acidovorax sp. NO-1]|uniref:hypothetical protein n=1 Tax=Acidovorax sp. NO-1 TaxID=512030 RepID=UPI00023FCDF2|nr:hypothetical protein [Acidovorax sp. NO-1]EHL24406.1 hypothetical protein KYG_03094 [Acidovorax sp. NO-1]
MTIEVLKAPAGCGKTHAYVDMITRVSPLTQIEIYVPTIKLAEEIKQAIAQRGTAHRASVIRGREQIGPHNQPLCMRHILAAAMSSKGVSVFPTLCMQRTQYGTSHCQNYEQCGYIQQYQQSNIHIYTHAHLQLGRTMLNERQPDLVIIDEDFTMGLVEHIEIPMSLLSQVRGQLEFQNAVCAIMNWTSTQDHAALLREFQQQGGGWSDLAETLKKVRPAILPGELDQIVMTRLSGHQNVRPVASLLSHLDRVLSKGLVPTAIDITPNKLTVHHRHEITRFGELKGGGAPLRIFITDATISEMIVRQCLPIDTFREVYGQRNAIVVQCSDSMCSTSSLTPAKQNGAASQRRAMKRLSDVQALVDELATTGTDILVVGPSIITGNPARGIGSKLATAPNVHLAHFGAVRGIDAWKTCEVLVLIGRNEPAPQAVENIARAFFYDDPTPLQLTGQWKSQTRGFDMASGEQIGTIVEGHHDPRVHEVLMQIREAESIQALDRLRLIHNIEPKLVILLSKLPLPGVQVDQLLPWSELTRGSEFERLYRNNGGILPLNTSWIAHKTGKTIEATKKSIQRLLKKRHSLLRFSKWRMSPLGQPRVAQYRPVGQRSWSKFFSAHATDDQAKTALEALLGDQIKVKSE